MQTKKLLLLGLLIALPINILKSSIDYLDTTFGPNANGILTTTINTSSQVNGLAIDSNGNVVAVGSTTITGVQNLFAARYTSSGSLDNGFGTNGVVTTLSGSQSNANAVVVDSNNKVYAIGTDGSNDVLVVRYTTAGVLDSSFGNGGLATLSIGNGSNAESAVIDANGKIVVAGTTVINGQPNMFVARFTSSGAVDTSFGTNGFTTISNSNFFTGRSVKIDANANLVVGGSITTNAGTDFLIVRFTSSGAVDTSFGSSGIVTTNIRGYGASAITSILIDGSNRIIATGYTNPVGNAFALARYSSNGSIDTTFGPNSDGINVTDIGANAQNFSAVLDLNGLIEVTGVSDTKIATARYTANGSLDTNFGVNGILTTLVGSFSASANALALQTSDGRTIAAGSYITDENTGTSQSTLIRYNKNNTDFVNLTSIADNSTIKTKIPALSGTSSAANASVQITVNGTVFTTVSTDGSGNWTAGNTNVLPIGANTIESTLIVNSQTVVSHVTLFTVVDTFTEDAVFAYSTQSQTKTTSSYTAIPFNTIPVIGTWSYSNSVLTCNVTGTYCIQFIGHAGSTGLGTGATSINVAMAVTINGTEYLGSETNSNIDLQSLTTRCMAKGFVKSLNAGDAVRLNFGVTIEGTTVGTYTPGLIVNTNASGTQNAYSMAITRIG